MKLRQKKKVGPNVNSDRIILFSFFDIYLDFFSYNKQRTTTINKNPSEAMPFK